MKFIHFNILIILSLFYMKSFPFSEIDWYVIWLIDWLVFDWLICMADRLICCYVYVLLINYWLIYHLIDWLTGCSLIDVWLKFNWSASLFVSYWFISAWLNNLYTNNFVIVFTLMHWHIFTVLLENVISFQVVCVTCLCSLVYYPIILWRTHAFKVQLVLGNGLPTHIFSVSMLVGFLMWHWRGALARKRSVIKFCLFAFPGWILFKLSNNTFILSWIQPGLQAT